MANPNIWAPGAALSANSTVRYKDFIATAGQTLFVIPDSAFQYILGTSSLMVYVSGVAQRPGVDFTETSVSSFTLAAPAAEGTVVLVVASVELSVSNGAFAAAAAASAAAALVSENASAASASSAAVSAANLPNASTAGANKFIQVNPTATGWDYNDAATQRSELGAAALTGLGTQVFNVAQASNVAHSVRADDLQKQTHISATTGGTSTAFTAALSPAVAAYATSMRMLLTLHTAPGTNPTIDINGLGVKNWKYKDGTGTKQFITSAVCPSGHLADCVYDGTDVVLLNPMTQITVASAAEVATGTDNVKLVTALAAQGVRGRLINFTTITASNASWAKQAGTNQIVAACYGGGGNGGAGEASSGGCGGGGGGSGGEVWGYSNSLSSTYVATVGGAGATTSFGAIASAAGGRNGRVGGVLAGWPGSGAGDGGDGGFAGNAGTGGGDGGGSGGATIGGWAGGGGGGGNGGGNGGSGQPGAGGAGAANSGAGGGGGSAGGAGGAGGSGVIYVWEYT